MAANRDEAWGVLASLPQATLTELFAADPGRLGKLSTRLELGETGMLFDWSKTHLTGEMLDGFEALAEVSDFAEMRRRLFAGEVVNPT